MATLTIRNLADATHQALRERAAKKGLSMEEEARQVLAEATQTASPDLRRRRAKEAAESLRTALRAANGGVLPAGVVDEFIAERRAEATREEAENAQGKP